MRKSRQPAVDSSHNDKENKNLSSEPKSRGRPISNIRMAIHNAFFFHWQITISWMPGRPTPRKLCEGFCTTWWDTIGCIAIFVQVVYIFGLTILSIITSMRGLDKGAEEEAVALPALLSGMGKETFNRLIDLFMGVLLVSYFWFLWDN